MQLTYILQLFLQDETKLYINHPVPCFLLYKMVSLSRTLRGGTHERGTFHRLQEYRDFII